MHWTPAPPPFRPSRPRWVIAEPDVNGTIDEHAALCLRLAIEDSRVGPSTTILVDLRELTAIAAAGVSLFVHHDADCRARGVALGLLICGDARHDEIARAFDEAGLGDQLQFTCEPGPPPRPRRTRLRRRHARAAHAGSQRSVPLGVSATWLLRVSALSEQWRGRTTARH
jgi:anti-anti-sigma regulatory factor